MILGEDRRIQPAACLQCNAINDGATSVGEKDETPGPGSICICSECGHIMAYGDNMQMRELTEKEMLDIAGDPRIITIQQIRELFPLRKLFQKISGA
jgi:hypothetical protein